MRELVLAGKCAESAVAVEQAIDSMDDFLGRRIALQAEGHVVERAVHVEGIGEGLVVHPHDAEVFRIGEQVAGLDLKDVFWRKGDADDPQLLAAAIDDCRDRIAQVQIVGFREGLADEHFIVAARRQLRAAPQVDLIQERIAKRRQRNQLGDGRLVEAFDVECDILDDSRFDSCHARHFLEPIGDRVGRAFDASEEVGKMLPLVKRRPRDLQGMENGPRIDKRGNAGGNHDRNRKGLTLHLGQVAEQFAVQCADH